MEIDLGTELKIETDNKNWQESESLKFPYRPFVNVLLIFLTTIQLFIIIYSPCYLRGDLIRSFLTIYVDSDKYSELYSGNAFYIEILSVSQLQQNLLYTFDNINRATQSSFLNLNYSETSINLDIQYLSNRIKDNQTKSYSINSSIGIVEPFNMKQLSSIPKFLLQISWFKLSISNININNEGYSQKYLHEIIYHYEEGIQIKIQFNFLIDNSIFSFNDTTPEGNSLILIRGFHIIVLLFSLASLYLNYRYIRHTYILLFDTLNNSHSQNKGQRLVHASDCHIIHYRIAKQIKKYNLTLDSIRFLHYIEMVEIDVIFSVLSNIFEIIGSLFLAASIEKQIIIGLSCFMCWMTSFKILRSMKRLLLMYQLIQLSIVKVILFFVEFLPIFIAFSLLGLCLFPKVIYFSSMNYVVTTLVSMMLGDSIRMITAAIMQKYSTILAMVYIFSFVLLFMHLIHNTLTALIKQFFILKKIEMIKQKKIKNKDSQYLYIQQIRLQSQIMKKKMPIKWTSKLKMDLLRKQNLRKGLEYKQKYKKLLTIWDSIKSSQRWIYQQYLLEQNIYFQQIQYRLKQTYKLINRLKKLQQLENISLLSSVNQ